MLEMEVVGVRIEMPSNQPIVLLKIKGGEKYLPIWIGTAEASAIALAHQGVEPPRPLTHDLLLGILDKFHGEISQISIDSLESGVFKASIKFTNQEVVDARPSDALVLALRASAPIYCQEQVIESAGIDVPDDQEKEVDQFRQFLDEVNPEDFGSTS
jgi:bifunctional DNase/RNase